MLDPEAHSGSKAITGIPSALGTDCPCSGGVPVPVPLAHFAGVGEEGDVHSDESPDLLPHEVSLHSRLNGR